MGDIFGIGIEELIFVGVLIALLFGPESIPRMARSAGQMVNRLVRSSWFKEGQQLREQVGDIRSIVARLAELEELQSEINTEIRGLKAAIDLSAASSVSSAPELSISPPASDKSPADAQPNDSD